MTAPAALGVASRQLGFARARSGTLRDVITAAAQYGGNSIVGIDGGPAGLLLGTGPRTVLEAASNYGS